MTKRVENMVAKGEIEHFEQFLLLPQCFPLFVIGYPFNYGVFLCFDKKHSKSSAAELSYEGKGQTNARHLRKSGAKLTKS